MYHQGRTKESSFTKVITTYGMNRISSESAQMDFLEGVYQLKKESILLKDPTHHHMEVIMGHSVLMQKSGKVDFSGHLCMKTRRFHPKVWSMSEAREHRFKRCHALTNNLQIELFDV
jgi:hypothetical protein